MSLGMRKQRSKRRRRPLKPSGDMLRTLQAMEANEEVTVAKIADVAHDKAGEPIPYEPERPKVPLYPADHYLDAAKAVWRLGKARAVNRIEEGLKTAWREELDGKPGYMLDTIKVDLIRELWPHLTRDEVWSAGRETTRVAKRSIRVVIPAHHNIPGTVWFSDEWLDDNPDYKPQPRASKYPNGPRVSTVKETPVVEDDEIDLTSPVDVSQTVTAVTPGFSIEGFAAFIDKYREMETQLRDHAAYAEKAKQFENFKYRLRELMKEFDI